MDSRYTTLEGSGSNSLEALEKKLLDANGDSSHPSTLNKNDIHPKD